MSAPGLRSDHVYDWSGRSIKQNTLGVAQAPSGLAALSAAFGCDLARLADRALQALRQARLQMRGRSGTRSQVLPLSELSRRAATDGLCAAGRSGRDSRAGCQLPAGTRSSRRNLSDQPRTIAAPRGAVRAGGERSALIAHRIDRYRRHGAAPCQHDRALAGCRALRGDGRGGER